MNDKTKTYYIGCGPIGCFLWLIGMFVILMGAWRIAEAILKAVSP